MKENKRRVWHYERQNKPHARVNSISSQNFYTSFMSCPKLTAYMTVVVFGKHTHSFGHMNTCSSVGDTFCRSRRLGINRGSLSVMVHLLSSSRLQFQDVRSLSSSLPALVAMSATCYHAVPAILDSETVSPNKLFPLQVALVTVV